MSLLNVNQFNTVDSVNVALDGSIPVAIQFGDNLWSSNYPDGILLSKGTTAERSATPIDGYIRYNTDLAEFEGFTNAGWRPTGQLTIDGSAVLPSRSLISDNSTGTFLIGSEDFGISVGGSLRIEVTADETFICDELRVDGILGGNPAFLRITTPNTEIGSLTWSDNDNTLPTVEAFIRYDHPNDLFEFSGDGSAITFEIDNATNETTFNTTTIFVNPIIASVGSAGSPAIRFDDANTGIYQRNSDEVNTTVGGVERFRVSSTEVQVRTNFQTNFIHTRGPNANDMEITETLTNSLLATQTNTTLFTFDGNDFQAVIVEYLVQKGAGANTGHTVGTFHIVVDELATVVDFVDMPTAILGAHGITFAASISTGTVTVDYTSGAGVTAKMIYVIKRWGFSP